MFGGHEESAQPAQDTAAPVAAPDDTVVTPTDGVAGSPVAGAPPLPGYDTDGLAPTDEATPAAPAAEDEATPAVVASVAATPAAADDLLDIKQQALQQLSPLVGHLDQTPEEKFRTTMMMIQASDNQALVKEAYDAALAITDEKVRAQALLDIVNEINYFTQHQDQQ